MLPGLAYRDDAGHAARPTTLAPIPHPDELPDLPYHRVDIDRYPRPTFMGRRTLAHHSSYGCPFFCNFCAVVNMVGGRWLAQSAERTAHRSPSASSDDHGVDAVEFYDNNFFVARGAHRRVRRARSCRCASAGGARRASTRCCKYSDRTWELMRDSGLRMVFLGAESGSDETLKRMNKGGTASTDKTLEIAAKMTALRHRARVLVRAGQSARSRSRRASRRCASSGASSRSTRRPRSSCTCTRRCRWPASCTTRPRRKASAFPRRSRSGSATSGRTSCSGAAPRCPWIHDPLRKRLQEFEWVLNARYPTSTDLRMTPWRRRVLKAAAAWRYQLGVYNNPVELRALQRVLPYRRPETSGF